MSKKCFVCNNDIFIDEGDMFIKVGDDDYMCGNHYLRVNELEINPEVVEKILEEKFGGSAVILGDAKYKIFYN